MLIADRSASAAESRGESTGRGSAGIAEGVSAGGGVCAKDASTLTGSLGSIPCWRS
jgi:hypothetical protein